MPVVHFWPQTLVDYAQIVSALATAAAVMISLYFALRRPQTALDVDVGLRLIIQQGWEERPEIVYIGVTNAGPTDALVTNVGWRMRLHWWSRRSAWAAQVVGTGDPRYPNPTIPLRLRPGDRADLILSCYGPHDWFGNVRKEGFFTEQVKDRRDLDRLRCVVHSSIGKPTFAKPSLKMLDRIWQEQRKHLDLSAKKLADEAAYSPET